MPSLRSKSEFRKAELLIRQLQRLRADMNRRDRIGYGTRSRTRTADTRRRNLNSQIIYHLHQAKVHHMEEGSP